MSPNIDATIENVRSAFLALNRIQLRQAFDSSGLQPIPFAEEVLMPVLDQIGTRWQAGELSLAQVYMSGRMCEDLIAAVAPHGLQAQKEQLTLAVAVLEDFHILGKRIMCSVLYAAGFEFIDYGPIALKELVEKVQKDKVKVLLISTLMLASALRVKLLKDELALRGLDVKLIVGGAPFRFDQNLWHEVGADATSLTASGVVTILKPLLTGDVDANA